MVVTGSISMATADRSRSLAFYRDGLGLEAFGPLADDGVPEPGGKVLPHGYVTDERGRPRQLVAQPLDLGVLIRSAAGPGAPR